MSKNNFNFNWKQIVSAVTAVLLAAAHITIILVGVYAFRYYNMYPALFNYLFVILICLFAIIDIIYIVNCKYKGIIAKIVICVISIALLIGGLYGTSILKQTNALVDNVVLNENDDKYETVGGVYASYQNEKLENISSIADLKTFSSLTVGTLVETSEDSISSIGLYELEQIGVKYVNKEYTNNTNLLFALINHEVDMVIFSNMYQAVFKADENVDYTQYLADIHEIDSFSKEIQVEANTSTKDLSKDPFNVLLIGWSPVEGSKTVGLADAIIVASVNPQTYTVSMMSIARDSYVPISCYGGQCDKINSGRGTSMDCFVSTVETLIDEDIDFYMEIDFSGFADLCGHFGGIEIDNPVSFELDGVYVPAGHYVADGWQALQFARERHHMPNGDFDRQQHQKEVIMQLAKQFLTHSLSDALEAFNVVSNRLNTNLTLNQLTSMFNMLTSTKNYTGLSLFNILDMHALRVTGYGSWHYSDQYELPLWIYKLYDGSISESLNHMEEVLGNYKTINQDTGFSFNIEEPYVRAAFYSTEYDEVETHEELPIYYINLTTMTYQEALAWARENGATLVPKFIGENDDGYDESLDGYVIAQSVGYGKKVSKYPSCTITVMGNGKKKVTPPDFDGWDLERAILWCKDKEVSYTTVAKYIRNTADYSSEEVIDMSYDRDAEIMTIKYAKLCGENSTPNEKGTACDCNEGYNDDGTGACKLFVKVPSIDTKSDIFKNAKAKNGSVYTYENLNYVYKEEFSFDYEAGKIISINPASGSSVAANSTITITVSKGIDVENYAKVPKFKTRSDAVSSDFTIVIKEEYSESVDSDKVIRQSVEADTYAKKKSKIEVYVSIGRDPNIVDVPNFVGNTVPDSSDFNLKTTEEYSEYDAGIVIRQDVDAGSRVAKGTKIKLTVSKGGCEDGYELDGQGGCKIIDNKEE